ncbi:MAG: DUF1549 domain-containing protein, partial [Planctomycetales bacterium]|nr:DUF1549 domain-containing protein [Planctomycetales bacterium]
LNSAFTATQSGKATRSDATPGGVAERSWDGGPSPIDQLLDRAQRRAGVRPLAAAAEAIWLRRVTLDLTGIPPTPQALQEFQRDRSPQRKTRVVDALLASSDYGQRWGRHWMDVWRYSDWDGYKQQLRGSQRHIWHWRDWIIESLNKNKPYDQMIMEMLAGDELAPTDPQVLRATGFIARNYHKSNRNIQLDALVEHTGKAFLGLTFNCAKCHDHKFDPIEQRSFYAMRAVFEPHGIRTDQLPGQSDVALAGLPRAYDAQLDTPTYMFLRGDEKLPLEDDPVAAEMLDWIPSDFQPTPVDLPLESYYPELSQTAHRNQMAEKQQAVRRAYEAWQEGLAKKELPLAEAGAESDIAAQEKQLVEQQRLAFALQVATADSLAYSARYAAERAKYTPSTKGELRASLARVAARVEHEQQRLVGQQKVFLQTQALDAARNSSEAVAAKRQAAIDKASKALSEAEEQLAKLPVTLDCDCEKYTPLGAPAPAKSSGRRLALARWIVDPRNPLTARVAVNHIWMRHFGRPLVENVFDFGLRSPEPKLVEVLDWLACELVDSGWDLKHLHRLIVLSDAYSRASSVGERQSENIALDPDNDLLWRFNVQRLDAEQIRDSLLAVAGELDGSLSGPDIDFELGEKIPRRSLYFRHAYEKQMPMMVLFDAASPNDCYRRRPSI